MTADGSILHGDCIEVMAGMEPESIDAIVCDPPYGLGFMGKAWDTIGDTGRGSRVRAEREAELTPNGHGHTTSAGPYLAAGIDSLRSAGRPYQAWCEAWAVEALRVAKPGAYLLAFGGTRTYHRLACAIEDAGWEIRDCLVWAYASGFPKSLDVSKAIDKAAGHWRGRAGAVTVAEQPAKGTEYERTDKGDPVTAAASWNGWGTALKPAWEPIVMARKPLRGTVAANVQRYGTGALNIDGARIPFESASDAAAAAAGYSKSMEAGRVAEPTSLPTNYDKPPYDPEAGAGRWPANVMLTDAIFDGGIEGVVGGGESEGMTPALLRRGATTGSGLGYGSTGSVHEAIVGYGDSGTYSRFFLIPKASRTDREPVLRTDRELAFDDLNRNVGNTLAKRRENSHPTVKPVDLMRHLVRLVTPPGGTVLDPFLGSGTTGIAAELEGFDWIGIEQEAEYVAIAEARLNGTQRGLGLG